MDILKSGILAIVLTSLVAAVLLVADQGSSEPCSLAFSLETPGCFLRSHKELAGGLIGAAGTIFAAWLAWLAIQRQIIASRWYETDLRRTIIEEISPFVDLLDQMLLAIDSSRAQCSTNTFCSAGYWEQIEQANEKKDTKKADELSQKMDELGKKLGPEYVALMVGLEEIDAESKDGQEIGSTLVALDKLCAN